MTGSVLSFFLRFTLLGVATALTLALPACDDLGELSGTIEIVVATPGPSAPEGTLAAEVRATASKELAEPAPPIVVATSTGAGAVCPRGCAKGGPPIV